MSLALAAVVVVAARFRPLAAAVGAGYAGAVGAALLARHAP
jgi:hypothetical protein